MAKPIVAVMTSAHPPYDVRIYHKQCKTLAQAGYHVVLCVPHERAEIRDGVRIHNVRKVGSRWQRMLITPFEIYRAVLDERATICHFHDPELIPVGILLKLRGRRVVYDVHENLSYDTLEHKDYIPKLMRWPLSLIIRILERGATACFDRVVAATPAIAASFSKKKTTLVQNYPLITPTVIEMPDYSQRPAWMFYAGMISEPRGIREMINALALLPESANVRLKLVGSFSPESLEQEVRALPGWGRVDYLGWQPREQIDQLMTQCRLGLVIYYSGRSHNESQPNKMFEYMAAGIPVIASNFRLWHHIVESANCGLLVDPQNPESLAQAMQWILDHPAEAEAMGRSGRAAVEAKYNWERESIKLIALYDRLLA